MKRWQINFLRRATEHEIAHAPGDRGPRPETIEIAARSKTAAQRAGREYARQRGWRLMDIREL